MISRKLKKAWLLPAACAVLVLAACSLPTAAALNSGPGLATDASRHLLEDAVYTTGRGTETFAKDGSYEYLVVSWDAASSSWKQTSGDRGSYTYDTATFTIVTHITSQYTAGTWTETDETETYTAYLTEHAKMYAYDYAAGTLTRTITTVSASYTDTTTISYAITGSTYTYDYLSTATIGSSPSVYHSYTAGEIVGSFPANTTPAVGVAVTYQYRETEDWYESNSVKTNRSIDSGTFSFTLIDADTAVIPATSLTRTLD